MNATFAAPTTISLACPWCDEQLALDYAFAATAVRCGACATTVDIEPVGAPAAGPSMEIAA